MSDLYLTPDEVEFITAKKQVASQLKVLRAMGCAVNMRPDGSFWVPRAQFVEKAGKRPEPSLNLGALNVA